VKIEDAEHVHVFLDTALKNGAVKTVPSTQTYVDDFPAYYDSLDALFKNLGAAIQASGGDWIKSAASARDIDKQMSDVNGLFLKCKS
jgi:hypothetical protein